MSHLVIMQLILGAIVVLPFLAAIIVAIVLCK
jgi:hypothetical protein